VIGTLSLAPWLAPASPVPGLIHHSVSGAGRRQQHLTVRIRALLDRRHGTADWRPDSSSALTACSIVAPVWPHRARTIASKRPKRPSHHHG